MTAAARRALPWLTVPLLLATLAGLVVAQRVPGPADPPAGERRAGRGDRGGRRAPAVGRAVLDRCRGQPQRSPNGTARPRWRCSPRPGSPPCRPAPTRRSRWSPAAAAAGSRRTSRPLHEPLAGEDGRGGLLAARAERRHRSRIRAGAGAAADGGDTSGGRRTSSCAASTTAASTRRRSRLAIGDDPARQRRRSPQSTTGSAQAIDQANAGVHGPRRRRPDGAGRCGASAGPCSPSCWSPASWSGLQQRIAEYR